MNERRLTELSAAFLFSEGKVNGVVFECPRCNGNCWIEARWQNRTSPREPLYLKTGLALDTLTLSPAIDTSEIGGCGFRGWIHDGVLTWDEPKEETA